MIDKRRATLLAKFRKHCYCDDGEGTFYGRRLEEEVCAWCKAAQVFESVYKTETPKTKNKLQTFTFTLVCSAPRCNGKGTYQQTRQTRYGEETQYFCAKHVPREDGKK